MPQECSDSEREALNSLFDQLRLALKLLELAQPSGDLAWRAGILGNARDAYQQALDAIGGMPPLSPEDRRLAYDRIAEFRSVIADLENRIRKDLSRRWI